MSDSIPKCPCMESQCDCCIQVFGACVEFENFLALDDVSFAISPGVLTGVVGPNGGGKSTPVSYTHLTLPTKA